MTAAGDARTTRRLPISGTTNVRDVGGHAISSNTTVTEGVLYRAEAIVDAGGPSSYSFYDATAAADFRRLGLRSVVDLRAVPETLASPSAWPRATGAELFEIPVAEGGEGADTNYVRLLLSGDLPEFGAQDMGRFYIDLLHKHADAFGKAFTVIADPERQPALVHCAAGKDRTGVFVALVLAVLGVPDEEIIGDYTLTGVLRPNRVNAYAHRFIAAGRDPDIARVLFETPAEAMVMMLDHLRDEFGGARDYLMRCAGVEPGSVDSALSTMMTTNVEGASRV